MGTNSEKVTAMVIEYSTVEIQRAVEAMFRRDFPDLDEAEVSIKIAADGEYFVARVKVDGE